MEASVLNWFDLSISPDKSCRSLLIAVIAWVGGQEPISQRVYELIIEISQKYFCSNYYFYDLIMWHFCTCHDSSAVVTCVKLWHDLIIISNVRAHVYLQDFDYELINTLWNGSQVIALHDWWLLAGCLYTAI